MQVAVSRVSFNCTWCSVVSPIIPLILYILPRDQFYIYIYFIKLFDDKILLIIIIIIILFLFCEYIYMKRRKSLSTKIEQPLILHIKQLQKD